MTGRLNSLPSRIAVASPRVRPAKKIGDLFYFSDEWRQLVARLIAMRGHRCEKCGISRDEMGKPVRLYGDHIVEIKDGGSLLDPANVELMCAPCHGAKTAAERAKRMGIRYVR